MKKDTKKRMLVWLLMLSLLLPLSGMTNEVHAEENPTPPPPPIFGATTMDSSHLFMGCSGDPSEDWIHEWRLSSTPDMMSSIWDDFTDNAENEMSIEFTESLRNMIDGIVYVAARYVYLLDSSLGSEWSNIYAVEIDRDGYITKVEPAEMETNPSPSEYPSSKSSDGQHEAQTVQPTGPATQPSNTLQKTEGSSGYHLWLVLLAVIVLLLAVGLIFLNRKKRTSKQSD